MQGQPQLLCDADAHDGPDVSELRLCKPLMAHVGIYSVMTAAPIFHSVPVQRHLRNPFSSSNSRASLGH